MWSWLISSWIGKDGSKLEFEGGGWLTGWRARSLRERREGLGNSDSTGQCGEHASPWRIHLPACAFDST